MILLTGAGGFIGSHLLPRLLERGRVRCVIRKAAAARLPSHPHLEIVEGDVTDTALLKRSCEGVRVILHLAARLRSASPAQIEAVNADSTRVLIDEAKRSDIEYFVYLSSENALRVDLTDAYAGSKRRAEAVVREFPRYLILQPCFIYGPGDHHGLGRVVDMAEKRLVVPLFGGLTAYSQPVYIRDVIDILMNALERRITGSHVIAGPDRLTLNAIIRLICEIRGLRRLLVPVPKVFFALAALMGDRFTHGKAWGRVQMKNIYDARIRDSEPAQRIFGVRFRGIKEGLEDWFGPHVPSRQLRADGPVC